MLEDGNRSGCSTVGDGDLDQREQRAKDFFRYARVFSPAFDRASQPVRIIITWKFPSETGQPATEEQQRMILFEDAANEQLNPQQWHDLVRLMAPEGAVATDDELHQITEYLAKSFPSQKKKEDSTGKEAK
jgi:hypothetical protein